MIVVLIRHSQSMNNHIASTHPETYDEERKDDPELSPLGVSQMKSLGLFLKSKGIVFDRYFCSPFYRALMSTKALFEAMDKPTDSVEILVPIHEYGGCNMKGKGYPGKSQAFVSRCGSVDCGVFSGVQNTERGHRGRMVEESNKGNKRRGNRKN
eukprot:TRINITY_DN1850_c0_g1_i2.p1 TRINITY_DN1850_c0_g1~~TRINITY_DN1850_c0_g1_i2.p1  ORF type:complete len:154 (+),score=30.56 TRINITY_DN1850_c0_g1_i2:60-521(+)